MTNHAFVHAKRINYRETRIVLHEIVKRRFEGCLDVNESSYGFHITKLGGDDFGGFLDVKISNHRRIEMRKGHQPIADWIQNVIQNDLARHYGGLLGNEVLKDRWKPTEPNKYYSDFITRRWDHAPSAKEEFLSMGVKEVREHGLEKLFAKNLKVFVVMYL